MSANPAAASVLEKNAPVIARHACKHLLRSHQDIRERFGGDAQRLWTDHLQQRALELSAAVAAGDPALFASRLNWSRTAMRARDITPEDLRSSLDSLQSAVEESLEGEAREDALECIRKAQQTLDRPAAAGMQSTLDAGLPEDRLALHYLQTVMAGNVFPAMDMVLDAVSQGMPIRDAYLKVLLPAQQEIGRLWHLNEISIAEEHLVSYTTQRVMALLSTRMPRKPDNGLTVIAGSVAGNVHDIGIRAISYLFEFDGWRTIYLGSDIPRQELPATMDSYDADLLLLSVALVTQLPATERAIAEIREHCQRPVKIMVGGNGLAERPGYWKEMGADGYAADAIEALELASELVTGQPAA
jgi:methanogenic corrinoid protein MtbC1